MSQRSITKGTLGVMVIGLIGLVALVGFFVGAVVPSVDIALLAQNAGLGLAIVAMLALVMLSFGRGS